MNEGLNVLFNSRQYIYSERINDDHASFCKKNISENSQHIHQILFRRIPAFQ